jgi:predicted LPLAT superfamily acyltransferase
VLRFVWVNEPGELLVALKEAGASSDVVALQCDRPEHSARTEAFEFLGAERVFPFTIYHLAIIFGRPVILSFGAPFGTAQSMIYASPAFEPFDGEPRKAALRVNPYQWLNFRPL